MARAIRAVLSDDGFGGRHLAAAETQFIMTCLLFFI
jgi:hypothetical protein